MGDLSPRVRRQITRSAFGFGFVLAALWAAHIVAVVYIPKTESYGAAQQFIRTSPEISAEVGRITDLRVVSASAFRPWSSTDWERSHFRVRVTGSRGTVLVWMTLTKVSGVWKPTAAALNDENGRKLKLQ